MDHPKLLLHGRMPGLHLLVIGLVIAGGTILYMAMSRGTDTPDNVVDNACLQGNTGEEPTGDGSQDSAMVDNEREESTYVIASDELGLGYIHIPAGAVSQNLEKWLARIMKKPSGPNAPPELSPWDPSCIIWLHKGNIESVPTRKYVIVANGSELYLGDKHKPRKRITPADKAALDDLIKKEGVKLKTYEEHIEKP